MCSPTPTGSGTRRSASFLSSGLERDSQLVIPVYNYCFPENECVGTTDDDPCTLFGRIRFPVEEFYPPDNLSTCDSYRSLLQ